MPIREENREKARLVIVAACVIFAVLLIIAFIVGMVNLASAKSRKNRLQRHLAELDEQVRVQTSHLDYYKSDAYIERIAREYLDMCGDGEITFVGK